MTASHGPTPAARRGYPVGLAYPDRNNFAPRVGASYNPGGGRYVLRAGYGGFYAYPEMNLWCNQVHNVPLVFPEIRTSNNFIPSLSGFDFTDPVLGKTLVGFTALDPHWQIPFIQQASASVERQIGDTMVVEVGYTGAWGRNLDRARLVNNAAPSPLPLGPRRPYQTISFVEGTVLPDTWPIASMTFPVGPINLLEFTARSSYNAGYVQAKRRLADGLSFLASYTYARSMSDSPSFRSAAMEPEVPQDSYNLAADWGPAGCDIRHRFVTSLIYQLPLTSEAPQGGGAFMRAVKLVAGDWQVAVIHQMQSGFPFTISVFGDTANAGALLNVNPVRANAVPGQSPDLPKDERTADRWFNTAAFATPPAYTFGNAGRNSMYGPGLQKTDVALQRDFPVRRRGETRVPRGGVQCLQSHEPRDARALREHAPVRQRGHGGHGGSTDPVRGTREVLGRASITRSRPAVSPLTSRPPSLIDGMSQSRRRLGGLTIAANLGPHPRHAHRPVRDPLRAGSRGDGRGLSRDGYETETAGRRQNPPSIAGEGPRPDGPLSTRS